MTERNQDDRQRTDAKRRDGEGSPDGDGPASGPSRRQFLGATASAGALAGLGVDLDGVAAQEGDGGRFFERGTEVGVEMVADGPLTAPTDFAVADGEETMRFVADQTGEVYRMTGEGIQEEPFVDVSDRMVELGRFYGLYAAPEQEYDERGLLGIDLHPEFADNGRFYLHYSAPPTDELRSINWDHVEVVSEFQASDDLASADPESERELLRIPAPQYNHDGGPMAFGPDGYLYVPMGDGGGANDDMYGHVPDWYDRNTGGNAQDLRHNLLGDVLRIDVDGGTAGEGGADGDGGDGEDGGDDQRPYGIPDDNPFVDTEGARDEIYAYGFRNPFGISFDSEGNCFVADSGQNLWEEANLLEAGGNYGWNVLEGTHCFSTEQPSDVSAITDCPEAEPDEAPYDGSEFVDPIVEYPHQYQGRQVGIVVVGGHRYEASDVSGLEGKYVFGDWSADPGRQEPAGRVFAATPPEDFGGADGAGNATDGGMGNETGVEVAENETGVDATGNETVGADGNETVGTGGNETAGGDGPGGEQVVPRDELWEMEELVFAGSENGQLGWFVRQFGQGQDGEVYVLVSKRGVPQGDTGAVLRIVPPGEGGAADAGNVTAENVTDVTDEPGNASTVNATDDGNATDVNATETGNATGDGTDD